MTVATPKKEIFSPDYDSIAIRRKQINLLHSISPIEFFEDHYKNNPIEFIEDFCDTYDPRRKGNKFIPFILFDVQKDLIRWLLESIETDQGGLIEKSRDMGATWVACAFSIYLWRFVPGSSVGFGSRKEVLVDRLFDPDSIFEKMRLIIRRFPAYVLPKGFNPEKHLSFCRIINPDTDSTITGESGDNIGRGGRKLIYFKDEAAHYQHAESIEAALSENTNIQIDMSSVNGVNNIFYRKAHSNSIRKFVMDWRRNPLKSQSWYDKKRAEAEEVGLSHVFARETDRDYSASVEGVLIPNIWVKAAIDAHKVLGFEPSGQKRSGLDVANEGRDSNALVHGHGVVVQSCKSWHKGDPAATSQKAVFAAELRGSEVLTYDNIGVGADIAGVHRLIINRRKEQDSTFKSKLRVEGWCAGGAVRDKDMEFAPGKTNDEMFSNAKAQAYWELMLRFKRTYQMIVLKKSYPFEDLISLDSEIEELDELVAEISQPTQGFNLAGKIVINKTPEESKSPNRMEALVIQSIIEPEYVFVGGG